MDDKVSGQRNGNHPAETERRPDLVLVQQNGQEQDGKEQGDAERAFRLAEATEVPSEQADRDEE